MNALDELLHRLPRTILVVGKGGVGKTTCAAGLAAHFAAAGQSVILLSTDPAAALATVVGDTPAPRLDVRQLSAAALRRAFLDRWRDTIAEIIDRGTYLDRSDIDGLVDAALPGADEIFALLALADILAAEGADRIVVDTAPTGHTLRLLALPETVQALVALLEAMQDKHRFMVRALAHRYQRDQADAFLDEMRTRIEGLRAALTDANHAAALLVTRAEPVVVAETVRYAASLREARIRVAAVVVNAIAAQRTETNRRALAALEAIDASIPRFWIPASADDLRGLASVQAMLARIQHAAAAVESSAPHPSSSEAAPPPSAARRLPPIRSFTIIGGKGGVGKTTVATALAIAAADDGGPVLLVSTDPAPSIADALGETDADWTNHDTEHVVAGVPNLVVRQMDAGAAFARLRDEYQSRIDDLFDGLIARGVDVAHDRAILRDLFALAPPGVDEIYALSILGDALEEGRFATVVIDPAPTGHLLRLLETPKLALDWTHRLMRLMLKYREVTGLGDTAEELLAFAKRTRLLDARLRDAGRAGIIIVTLDEPVVRAETARLVRAVREQGVDVIALVWNRATPDTMPRDDTGVDALPVGAPVDQFVAGSVTPPPVGVHALRAWLDGWCVAR